MPAQAAMPTPEAVEPTPLPKVEPMTPPAPATEKCANCGQPISPDFSRCPYCGAPVEKAAPAPQIPSPIPPVSGYTPPPTPTPSAPMPTYGAVPPAAPKKKLSTGWIIAIVILAILCICCLISGIYLWNNGDEILGPILEQLEFYSY
jgi:hypothetical protein